MIINKYYLSQNDLFFIHLLQSKFIKNIAKEFEFYNVKFVKDEKTGNIYLEYPALNPYWYFDFKKYIEKKIIPNDFKWENEWNSILKDLHKAISKIYSDYIVGCELKTVDSSLAREILKLTSKYNLRNYQALDLIKLERKLRNANKYKAGLILSEPRTGKSRIALAYTLNYCFWNTAFLIICPKNAFKGWKDEVNEMSKYLSKYLKEDLIVNLIEHTSDINKLQFKEHTYTYNIISYDLFKRLSLSQIKDLINFKNYDKICLIVDELHRLRNFKTEQSKAIFNFKDFIFKRYHDNFTMIGLTGTPAVKDSYDVFGILSFVNFSDMGFKPYYKDFNQFKEYFYNCEDTSFGKICKSLKRQDELNFLVGLNAVQTKQRDLDIFKNYTKKYKKIELEMDKQQRFLYEHIDTYMECENVDCKNNLVKYIRLQQICNDPSSLFPSYEPIAPKIKFIIKFLQLNKFKTLIISKSVEMLQNLYKHLDSKGIKCSYIYGAKSLANRELEIHNFKTENDVMLLQLDTCKEALTLPEADCTIFTDRSFVQGFNEQAEARMTPINGLPTTKFVIDLVMKDSIEEKIYNVLVQRKQNIKDVNILFKD